MDYVSLVIGAKLGRAEDYGELVRLFESRLLAYVSRYVYDADDAEEIAQDSFVAAWTDLGNLRNAAAFPGWLWRIARNQALARLAAQHARRDRSAPGIDPAELADSRDYGARETLDWERLTASLPSDRRALVDLRYLAGFSLAEIGLITGIPERLVKSRLYESRQKLKNALHEFSPPAVAGWNPEIAGRMPAESFKDKVMDKIDALRLGAEVFERLALTDQIAFTLAICANETFSGDLLAAIGRARRGAEFLSLYGSSLSMAELIGILNHVDRHTEARVVNELERTQPDTAEAIKRQLFVFEDLILFDSAAIARLVAAMDRDVFATAVAATTRDTREHILRSLPDADRADLRARMDRADAGSDRVKAAEQSVIFHLQELERANQLFILRHEEAAEAGHPETLGSVTRVTGEKLTHLA